MAMMTQSFNCVPEETSALQLHLALPQNTKNGESWLTGEYEELQVYWKIVKFGKNGTLWWT
jgi:hypothetical protein